MLRSCLAEKTELLGLRCVAQMNKNPADEKFLPAPNPVAIFFSIAPQNALCDPGPPAL